MSFLTDIEFPASKLDVIAAAADQGVPQEVLEALQRSEQERFEDRSAIEAVLPPDA